MFPLRELFMARCRTLFKQALILGIFLATHRSSAGASNQTFRVMTYNIHHGEGIDGKVDLERIAAVIKRENVDIAGLQEVDKGVERTGRRDFPAELAVLTGMSCVFSNNYNFQGGEYGNAILSRFPIKSGTNIHYVKVNETEQRGLLEMTLQVHDREVKFSTTHLDFRADDAARWSNVGEISQLIGGQNVRSPVILCGDFNDRPASRVCHRLSETFHDTWLLVGKGDGFTIPAERPNRRIDYIWNYKGNLLKPVKAWVPVTEGSDHRPLVTEFKFSDSTR